MSKRFIKTLTQCPQRQRRDTYQPGLPGPGRYSPQSKGLKARHIHRTLSQTIFLCVGLSALGNILYQTWAWQPRLVCVRPLPFKIFMPPFFNRTRRKSCSKQKTPTWSNQCMALALDSNPEPSTPSSLHSCPIFRNVPFNWT